MPTIAIGRDAEIGSGWRRLATGLESGPAAVLIEGEPGIGKSVVWREIVGRARSSGARVLHAAPAAPETAISYAGLSDLLADVADGQLAPLPDLQRRALEVACLRREPTGRGDDVRLVGTALASLLRAKATTDPVVVAIDDVQWLDGPTSRALAFALRRLPETRLGILLTRRAGVSRVPPLGLDAQHRQDVELISLGPLPPIAIRELVAARLGLDLTRAQARSLARLSGGNALFALELARTVVDASDDDDLWRHVIQLADVAELMDLRIRSLPPQARRVLAAAAALADPTISTLGAYLGSARKAASAIGRASGVGIAHLEGEEVRFEHPLLAAAALGALSAPDRRSLHGDLAAAIKDPEERARHLALADTSPNEEIAAAIAAGAKRASERGAQDAAAELAEAALRLTPDEPAPTRQHRAMTAAVHIARAGELRRARELCESLLAESAAGPARAALLRLVGEIRLQEDSFPEGIQILEQAIAEAGDEPSLRLPADLQLAYAKVNMVSPRDARPHGQRALEDAQRLGDPRLLGIAMAVNEITRFFVGLGFDLAVADRAIALEDPGAGDPALFRPSLVCAIAMNGIGLHLRAADLLLSVVRDARTLGDEASLVPALMYYSWSALTCGRINEAGVAAAEAVQVARSLGGDVPLAQALTATARVAAARGDSAAVERDAREAIDLYEQADWQAGLVWPASILGGLAWSRGDAAGTVEALEAQLKRHFDAGFVSESHPYVADLIEAYISLRRREEAESLLARLEPTESMPTRHVVQAMAGRCRALILAQDGELIRALAALDEAADHLAAVDPLPMDEARTLLVRGRIERRAKRRGAARTSLTAALDGFERLGARIWADRTREEIDRLGGPAPNELTPTETLVARLAAQGLTNREVAERAFVTSKSVEGILSRAYLKLGIRSRAELGAWATTLAEGDSPDAART